MKVFAFRKILVMLAILSALILAFLIANAETSSGTCGNNLTWTLDDEGVLTISGTGEMYDMQLASSRPWASLLNINTVVISEGVTSIDMEDQL